MNIKPVILSPKVATYINLIRLRYYWTQLKPEHRRQLLEYGRSMTERTGR